MSDAVSTSARNGGLQSENWRYLLGMLCYVSTHTEGYLYSLEPTGTQLLQTYQYSTQMIQVLLLSELSHFFRHVSHGFVLHVPAWK